MKTPTAILSITPTWPTRVPASVLLGAAAVVGALAWVVVSGEVRPHAPRLDLIAAAPAIIQLHIAAAVLALGIGTALLIGTKGRTLHKVMGWTWVVSMATVAVSSLFIQSIHPGRYSWIHLLSGWTIVALPMAVAAIKRRNIRLHRRMMTGLFVGGLIVAGAFTFVPGRLMWRVFVG